MNRYSTGTGKVRPILVHNGWIAWVTSCHNKASSWKSPIPNQLQMRLALRSLRLRSRSAHLLICTASLLFPLFNVIRNLLKDPGRWDSYEIPATLDGSRNSDVWHGNTLKATLSQIGTGKGHDINWSLQRKYLSGICPAFNWSFPKNQRVTYRSNLRWTSPEKTTMPLSLPVISTNFRILKPWQKSLKTSLLHNKYFWFKLYIYIQTASSCANFASSCSGSKNSASSESMESMAVRTFGRMANKRCCSCCSRETLNVPEKTLKKLKRKTGGWRES